MYFDEINKIAYLPDTINSQKDLSGWQIRIENSSDIVIGPNVTPTSFVKISGCKDVTVWSDGETTIDESTSIYVGGGCDNVTISKSSAVSVGNDNFNVTIVSSRYIVVGDSNENINITGSDVTIGRECSSLLVRGDFHNLNNCNDVNIDNQSLGAEIHEAESVEILSSLSTNVRNSTDIRVTRTPESTIRTSGIGISDGAPLRTYLPNNNPNECLVRDNLTLDEFTADKTGDITGRHGQTTLEAPLDGRPYVRMNGKWYAMVPDSTKAGGWDFVESTEKQ